MGPFLPSYYKGKWTDIYVDALKNNIKLFGSSINTCINDDYIRSIFKNILPIHVQSYIFSMNKETLIYLIENEIFSLTKMKYNFIELIIHNEIMMSILILNKGWNIGCLIPYYKNIDFTNINNCNKKLLGDLILPVYYNVIWNEYDVVFVKNNKSIRINLNNYLEYK
jgi:hypothetical protein